jgi:hypothetical protein
MIVCAAGDNLDRRPACMLAGQGTRA